MATVTKSNSLTVNPSGWDSSDYSYSSISTSYPITNAYTDTSSTTYAYITTTATASAVSYLYLTFDLSSIPSDATIGSVSCNVKGAVSSTSRITAATARLYAGSTAKGSSSSICVTTTSATSTALTCGTWTRSELDNLKLRFDATRGTGNNGTRSGYLYIYGAELTISYTWLETAYTITTTITGGTVTSTNPETVGDGDDSTITFTKSDDSYILKSMTVNGTDVTPTWIDSSTIPGSATITASTNTDEYTTDSNGIAAVCDGDSSTYYWTLLTQAAGDYILLTLSNPVYLTGVSSVCTKSSTDYFKSNCDLQISTDGSNWTTVGTCSDSSSQSFTGINQVCLYVRFYITTASNSWWCVNEITLTYSTDDITIPGHYEYTCSSVSDDQTVIIVFGSAGPQLYRKINDTTWKLVKTIYQKTSSGWVELSAEEFKTLATDKKFTYLEIPVSAIGNVTSGTNAINITDDSVASDTYTLYYEDSNANKLDNWDAIGTITKS